MKKKLLTAFIIACTLIIAMGVINASAGTYGDLYYDVLDGEVEITGCNALVRSVNIPSTIANYPVTSIGDGAFEDCNSLTIVTIPDSVTSIGDSAFESCESLISITIPDSVTSIGNDAFYCCSSLTSITIPDSVTGIGEDAFYGTGYYKNVDNWDNGVLYIGNHLIDAKTSISGSYTVKSGTKIIVDKAFYNCSSLTSITIPDSVTGIGEDAFYGTGYYKNVDNWDNGVLYIGNYLIDVETSISGSYVIKSGTKTIADNAFYYCTRLTSITIPDSVTSIGGSAFYNCSGIEEVHISDLAAWCKLDFNGSSTNPLYYAKKLYLNGELITELKIPDGVTSIGSYAFYNCSSLISITIPDSVTSIGDYAFYGCSSLTSIMIGNRVISIGGSAFSGCSGLTSITIPDSVTSIGDYAFFGCSGLTEIKWNAKNVSDFSSDNYIFYNAGQSREGVSVIFGKNVERIPAYVFYSPSKITSVTISDSVTSIGSSAFACSKLEEITLPFIGSSRSANGTSDAVFGYIFGGTGTSVEQYYSSSSYVSYTIPTNLKKVTITDAEIIPYGAFYDCDRIEEITINAGVTMIYPKAFYSCDILLDLALPMRNVKIANSNVVQGCEMVTICGLAESDVEGFANKYGIDFVEFEDEDFQKLDIVAEAINGKIMVTVNTSIPAITKFMPVGLYRADGMLIDVLIIPTYEEFETMKVVFNDNSDVSYAKVFLCNSFEDLTPLANAQKCEIKR